MKQKSKETQAANSELAAVETKGSLDLLVDKPSRDED
jgi:hypothetical protein